MKKLWQKSWTLDPVIESFETGDDLVVDMKLVRADLAGSMAHAMGLVKIGILTAKEGETIKKGLQDIATLYSNGKFVLQPGDEDIHTKIENYLTDHYGQVGKKIHTGRSRNDQVATAVRLYTKQELFGIWQQAIASAQAFLVFAKQYELVPMPGYTHMQKAMPMSVGMWASTFAWSLLDDLVVLQAALNLVDQSPLGSAAGFGVPLFLDRAYTAKLLGFASVQVNPLYVQNSRGKIEATVIASCVSILATINKFATDVLLFTTSEFGYFTVANSVVSGSSIMPQKKNVDVAELLRSKVHIVTGHYQAMVGISSNLISGYNRDLQDTKKPLMESLTITKESLKVAQILLTALTPNKQKLTAAMTPELFATHRAFAQVAKGVPFRDAYAGASASPSVGSQGDTLRTMEQSTHIGGTGNLGLPALKQKLAGERKHCQRALKQYVAALRRLGIAAFVPGSGTTASQGRK